jgi:hypothetical protein
MLVLGAGVFNRWLDSWLDRPRRGETGASFLDYHGAESRTNPSTTSPSTTSTTGCSPKSPRSNVEKLAGCPYPSLVMIGDDDDEIHVTHTLAMPEGLTQTQLAVIPRTATGSSTKSRNFATNSSLASASRTTPFPSEQSSSYPSGPHRGTAFSVASSSIRSP